MQQRPVGITMLAIAAAVLGVLAILAAGAWWNASEGLAWLPRIHGGERLIALVLLAVGLAELVFAYGAWTLRPWAWTFGVVSLELVIRHRPRSPSRSGTATGSAAASSLASRLGRHGRPAADSSSHGVRPSGVSDHAARRRALGRRLLGWLGTPGPGGARRVKPGDDLSFGGHSCEPRSLDGA